MVFGATAKVEKLYDVKGERARDGVARRITITTGIFGEGEIIYQAESENNRLRVPKLAQVGVVHFRSYNAVHDYGGRSIVSYDVRHFNPEFEKDVEDSITSTPGDVRYKKEVYHRLGDVVARLHEQTEGSFVATTNVGDYRNFRVSLTMATIYELQGLDRVEGDVDELKSMLNQAWAL